MPLSESNLALPSKSKKQPFKNTLESRQKSQERILNENVEKLKTDGKAVLESESWGGNAGHVKEVDRNFLSAALNGYIDFKGEIKLLGNIQKIKEKITGSMIEITFRAGTIVDFQKYKAGPDFILYAIFRKKTPKEAIQNVNDSIAKFNIDQAQDFEDLFIALDLGGGIKNSQGRLESPENIKAAINLFLQGIVKENMITRKFGLRDKVVELYFSKKIKQAKNIEQLYEILDEMKQSKSCARQEVSIDLLIVRLKEVEKGNLPLKVLSQKFGFQDKVWQLLKKE